MSWFIGLLLGLVLLFGGVALIGAPYVPTRRRYARQAIGLMGLVPGGRLLDVGCGDGTVLLAAAQAGYHAVGIEINPLLVLIARWRCRRYGRRVKVLWGNYWRQDWPPADAIYVFLAGPFMSRLARRLRRRPPQCPLLVSYAFGLPGLRPAKTSGPFYIYHLPVTNCNSSA